MKLKGRAVMLAYDHARQVSWVSWAAFCSDPRGTLEVLLLAISAPALSVAGVSVLG